ncbi:MAG: DUF3592 domain-containing protein [Ruminococcaceae bacterium]|jgi:hypothetical protein|nr:DUF3592 domain-containing protein [Oscillospiraceae bacterium]
MRGRLIKIIISIALLVSGIVVIVLGFGNMKKIKNFPEITATVTNVEISYSTDSEGSTTETQTVTVKYTVDGKEYEEILQYSPDGLEEGEEIVARYNPEKPEEITTVTKGTSYIMIAIGAVLVVAAIGSTALMIIRGY